eukprot:TRINITY_DN23331_c0_g1_i1.p1 TRINITY_DN23331_c0_g1~~TRINITY_DN23331_c0_g1_i1.p1  ORF type:complete len:163 (+),score=52.76 TRINITY_DN23331_c0_g1_i1:50-490(+)
MDDHFKEAVAQAREGAAKGGPPIGSVIVHEGKVIGKGYNKSITGSAVLHAEMDAFENGRLQPASVYKNSTLYTTLSPCAMCTGTMLLYGIKRVVIGDNTTYMGEEDLLRSRGVEVVVLQDPECVGMMRDYIAAKPSFWNDIIGEER